MAEKLKLKVGDKLYDKLYIVTGDDGGNVKAEDYTPITKVGTKFFYIMVEGREERLPLTITFPHYGLSHCITIFLTKEDWQEKNFRREFDWKVKNKNFNDIPLEKLKEAGKILGLWQA
jgi:hypothetical protein